MKVIDKAAFAVIGGLKTIGPLAVPLSMDNAGAASAVTAECFFTVTQNPTDE